MSVTISGRLFVDIVKATNLSKSDQFSNSDCYVVIKAEKKVLGKTKTIADNNNPVWNQSLHFDAEFVVGGKVSIEIYDHDRITRDDLIGKISTPFQSIPRHRDDSSNIVTSPLEGKKANGATLTYSISFRKFSWEEELAALEQSNQRLKQNVDQLHQSNAELSAISHDLHSEVEVLQATNNKLKGELATLHTENDHLEKVKVQLSTENDRFKEQNSRLKENVDRFQEQNSKLKAISDSLHEDNEHFKHEVDHLQNTISGLETVKATIEAYAEENKHDLGHILDKLNTTLADQKDVFSHQQNVLNETKEANKQQEKILLLQLQSQCQFLDSTMGMDSKEFQVWLSLIPKKFLQTPVGLEFSRIDRDRDGVISIPEFNALVDQLVSTVDD